MNYFELFGLPIQFKLDGSLLSSQFRQLQKQCHPDNFAKASERDRLLAVQKASQINDAYQVLKKPVSRAEYLLTLQNIEMTEQQTLQDIEFLTQQMELREELDTIENKIEKATELSNFEHKVEAMYQQHLTNVEQELSDKQWLLAVNSVRKLKFIIKLKYEIERIEDSIFD